MESPIVGAAQHLSLQSASAHLAELVDALVLGTSGFGRGGSSPPVGIITFLSCLDATFWDLVQLR